MTELMNCLNKKDREIFHKLYVEERDMNEVSEDTGIKREIIYNRISQVIVFTMYLIWNAVSYFILFIVLESYCINVYIF